MPLDKITILAHADTPRAPMTKTNTLLPDGSWQQEGCPDKPFLWRGRELPINSIRELAAVIKDCEPWEIIIRGEIHADKREMMEKKRFKIRRNLQNFGGSLHSEASTSHRWLMLDFDKTFLPDSFNLKTDPEAAVEWFIKENLPPIFHNVTCFWQLSSSAEIKPGFSSHVWFWIDRPVSGRDLHSYFKVAAPKA